jgi:hypothetical protein
MGSDSPKPDPDGHLRDLPQSFTRSQKERPLGEYRVHLVLQPLVAIMLHSHDEFKIAGFSIFSAFLVEKP